MINIWAEVYKKVIKLLAAWLVNFGLNDSTITPLTEMADYLKPSSKY
nr:MAG TPA: hypothetical protein [Caudoviricetes sp.]